MFYKSLFLCFFVLYSFQVLVSSKQLSIKVSLQTDNINGSGNFVTFPMTNTTARATNGSQVRYGIGCGKTTLKHGEIIQIQSNNFNTSDYFNNDACTWKFEANECFLVAQCPCFDVVPSWQCIYDYLWISDNTIFYHQKFCGETKPEGEYRSYSGGLTIRFRSNSRDTATGFSCYVQCTSPGYADQEIPTTACPTPKTRP